MVNRPRQTGSAWLDRLENDRLEKQRLEEEAAREAPKNAGGRTKKAASRRNSANKKGRTGAKKPPQPAANQQGGTGATPPRRGRQHRRATGPRYEEHLRPLMLRDRNVSVYFRPEDRRRLEDIAEAARLAPSRWLVSLLEKKVAGWERAAGLEPLTVADLEEPPPVWSGGREKAAGRTVRVGLAMPEMLYRSLLRLACREERSLSNYIRAAAVMDLPALEKAAGIRNVPIQVPGPAPGGRYGDGQGR